MVMIKLWKKALDEQKVAGAVLTDLSKAFDCLPHDLLIAKLHAYGFEKSALIFRSAYLTGHRRLNKTEKRYLTGRRSKIV